MGAAAGDYLALDSAVARLEAIINNTPSVAIQSFDRYGTIRLWNPACEMLYGYSTDYALGKKVQDLLLNPADIEDFEHKLEQIASTKKASSPQEWETRTASGEQRWVFSTMFPVLSNNAVAEIFCMDVDISARKKTEEESRKLEVQMQHAQRLESLGLLAGGIAHDFNNILLTVIGHIGLALADLSPVAPIRANLQAAESAAQRAADLCRQLLAYSGRGQFVMQQLNLNEAINEMAHMLKMSVSKKAMLNFNLAHDLPLIQADLNQVHQVLMNLIVNASEAVADRGGIISVSTGTIYCDQTFLEQARPDERLPEGDYVFLDVADTGCGMNEPILEKIFDPFFTTKFAGRGLGLSAVLGIMRGHGGLVHVVSEKNRGTTFRALFPPAAPLEKMPPEPFKPTELWCGSGVVLFVDDEKPIRELGESMLERLGFTPVLAADGMQALEIFQERQAEICCIILDLTMPRMDGIEALRAIRKIDTSVPVIMCSGFTEQELTSENVAGDISSFLPKPYQLEALASALRNVLST